MIFATNNFTGHWPVGTAAVVAASNPTEAAEKLNKVLREEHSLPGDARPEDMIPFPLTQKHDVWVLNNGEY